MDNFLGEGEIIAVSELSVKIKSGGLKIKLPKYDIIKILKKPPQKAEALNQD